MKSLITLVIVAAAALVFPRPAIAEDTESLEASVQRLEQRVQSLERRFPVSSTKRHVELGATASFVAGVLCALWAQNSLPQRNPWVWFFFGAFLGPIALLVMLYKNSNDPHVTG